MLDVIKENWSQILFNLKREHAVSDVSFKVWILPLEPYSFWDHTLTVIVPNKEFLRFIDRKYNLPLMVTVSEFLGTKCKIKFKSREEIEKELEMKTDQCSIRQRNGKNIKTDSGKKIDGEAEWNRKYRQKMNSAKLVEIKENWEQILYRLKEEVGDTEIAYKTWLLPMIPYSFDGSILTILVPSEGHQEYLQEEYEFHLEAIISELLEMECTVEFRLMEEIGEGTGVKNDRALRKKSFMNRNEKRPKLLDEELPQLVERLAEENRLDDVMEVLRGSDYSEKLRDRILNKILDDWESILLQLKKELKLEDIPFQIWLLPLEPYSFQNRTLTVIVPGGIFLRYIKNKYAYLLTTIISDRIGAECSLEFVSKELLEASDQKGIQNGETKLAALIEKLIEQNRMDDVKQVTQDEAYRRKLYQEFQII